MNLNPIEAARQRLTNHTLARSDHAPTADPAPPKRRDRAARIRATAVAREEARRVRWDRRRARRSARAAETARRRLEQRADRARRTAAFCALAVQVKDRVVVVLPIILVNVFAVIGQVGFATKHLEMDLLEALGFGVTLESVAVFVGWHAHKALLAGDSAIKLRFTSYLMGVVFGGLNYEHYDSKGGQPTVLAVTFGLLSAISPWLWAMHGRYANRIRLRALGLIDERAPHFSGGRWLHFPIKTLGALRWGIDHSVQDPALAWDGYMAARAEREARSVRKPVKPFAAIVINGWAVAKPTASPPPTGGAPGDNSSPPPGDSKRQVGDSKRPPTGDSDTDSSGANTPPTSRQKRPGAAAKKTGRRSMTDWVELAGPIFHAEFERLQRQPTGDEFAEAIKKAGLGKISPSTAKNIRTEILDRAPLPSLESEGN